MTEQADKKRTSLNRGRRVAAVLAILAALLLTVIVVIVKNGRHEKKDSQPSLVKIDTVGKKPSGTMILKPTDTVVPKPADTITLKSSDTMTLKPPVKKMRIGKIPAQADTTAPVAADTAAQDTVEPESETAFLEKGRESGCTTDTVPLWVYPEPSGGLHYGRALVRFRSNRKCAVSWYLTPDTAFRPWNGDSILVEKNTTLVYRAIDECGNAMPERRETYQVERAAVSNLCPKGMDQVKIGETRFCIDRYEWPNRAGAVPSAYVSLYQAMDSCFSVKKRLCTSEEWSLACAGPYSWRYPYGKEYEPNACITSDTMARPSGSRPECRAYFGAFDMSGNLIEWTSTPARENRSYNNVLGGFWESGPRSGCYDVRYSYFPQNRHNPVGFRCCKDWKE